MIRFSDSLAFVYFVGLILLMFIYCAVKSGFDKWTLISYWVIFVPGALWVMLADAEVWWVYVVYVVAVILAFVVIRLQERERAGKNVEETGGVDG